MATYPPRRTARPRGGCASSRQRSPGRPPRRREACPRVSRRRRRTGCRRRQQLQGAHGGLLERGKYVFGRLSRISGARCSRVGALCHESGSGLGQGSGYIIRGFTRSPAPTMNLRRPLVVVLSCGVLAACVTQAPAPAAPAVMPATPVAAGEQLNGLFERYFEDVLRLNPLLATFIGDHRYDDQLPNSIGPGVPRRGSPLNERYPRDVRRIDVTQLSPADRTSYDIFVRERHAHARGRALSPRLPAAGQQAGSLLDDDAVARVCTQRAAVRHRAGLRELAEAPRRHGRWMTRRSSTCARASPGEWCQPRPVIGKSACCSSTR